MSEQKAEPTLEIVITPTAGFADAGKEQLRSAKSSFDGLGQMIKESILPMYPQIRDSSNAPSEMEVRLELKLKGEAKWVVVSASGEATTAVRLVWKR